LSFTIKENELFQPSLILVVKGH